MDYELYTLQLPTSQSMNANLELLISKIETCQKNSIILAPEVFLSGFLYKDMQLASDFSTLAKKELLKYCKNKTLLLGMIEKKEDGFFNVVNVFHNSQIIYTQGKSRLFKPGGEHLHFKDAKDEDIQIFYVDDIKCGILNCFEIRFLHLWQRLRGADIIFTPASWAQSRKVHFESIVRAIAIVNQCYVVASCSANETLTHSSAIIAPYGDISCDPNADIISMPFDIQKIIRMREKINTTI